MKKLFLVIAIVAFSICANAQDSTVVGGDGYTAKTNTMSSKNTFDKNFIWSIGVEPSMPVGHFHDYAGFGFGGSVQGEIKTSKKTGLTINAGYIAYSGKTVDSFEFSAFRYWPVMGGLKIYLGKAAYIHGQAGAGFGTSGLGTSFWYGAGIGVNLGKMIDAEFRYAGWKQKEVIESGGPTDIYNGGTPPAGGDGGFYGGHYSTLGLRLAINF